MRPLIPKVRPGDVLLGTRNLRNFLQASSLLTYLGQFREDSISAPLFIPRKDDTFVVCVNTDTRFAVWGRDGLFIPFVNPMKSSHPPGLISFGDRMSQSLFPTWFIRTKARFPDVRKWSEIGYLAWASWQLGAERLPDNPLRVPTNLPSMAASWPFIYQRYAEGTRDQVHRAIQNSLAYHLLRPGPVRPPIKSSPPVQGPTLQDLYSLHEELRAYRSKKEVTGRVASRVMSEKSKAVKDLLKKWMGSNFQQD